MSMEQGTEAWVRAELGRTLDRFRCERVFRDPPSPRYGGQRARKTTRGARVLPEQGGELHGGDYGRLAAGVWSPRNQK